MKCAVNSLKRTGIIVERSLRSAEVTDETLNKCFVIIKISILKGFGMFLNR